MNEVRETEFGTPVGLAAWEYRLCHRLAEAVTTPSALVALRVVSRFGDWPMCALTGILLGLRFGPGALGLWALAALTGVAVQKVLKLSARRPRPCQVAGGLPQRTSIPDVGSFPSGHTLHAVMAAITVGSLLPGLFAAFVLLAFLMGLSRVALGVHYPSDVLAGAVLGALAAWAFLFLVTLLHVC